VGLRKLTKAERSEARKRLGYSDEDFLVGIIGRLEHGKGQEIFIEAARLCPSRRIKFLVVGSGSMERELTVRAEGLGNLRFLGHLSDVTEIMNLLDVNVNCSYISETSSLALSEGMSVGAIPVVSECGGNSFMARDCGVTVPKKDAQKLADVLVALSTSPATLAKLKARSEERFARLFTAKRMTEEVEALYLEMAKNNFTN
jgi:glycosyltransferase involved in cell wall biosynthesis